MPIIVILLLSNATIIAIVVVMGVLKSSGPKTRLPSDECCDALANTSSIIVSYVTAAVSVVYILLLKGEILQLLEGNSPKVVQVSL